MKSGLMAAGAAVLAAGAVVLCPASVRTEIAERTSVPEGYAAEAERQIDMFVAWLRDDASKPEQEARASIRDDSSLVRELTP
ncbi:hypothetical protein [Maricaulis sp.]|uniref:hypothetical protein n=1 Tax=Maricaulis sp. TaxID=1486257 RepID=UPI002633D7ED|nr:hypothetical protein [Maricaulis sp.]